MLEPAGLLGRLGLRRTPARVKVLEILLHHPHPLSAPQILEQLPADTDNVTLYRTLNTLTLKKLLHRIRGDDRIWRYGMGQLGQGARHEHAHFVCDRCGTMECLSDTPVSPKAAQYSALGPGYKVDYSEVLMHGTCPDCKK